MWATYRYFIRLPEIFDETIFKPVIFLGPVIFYIAQKKISTIRAFGLRNINLRGLLGWGLGFGSLLVLENIIVWLFKGRNFLHFTLSFNQLIMAVVISLGTAISEELLYRAFILEEIWKMFQKPFLAIFLSTLLFMLGHISIAVFVLNQTGWQLVSYLLLMSVMGFAEGFVYTQSRSVYASIIVHLLWNLSNSFF